MSDFLPIVRFMAVSDLHIKDEHCTEEERFEKALCDAYLIAKKNSVYDKLDAICVIGDFADSGTETQMKKVKSILDKCVDYNETKVIMQIASHETNNPGIEEAARRFKEILGSELDNHEVIKGFHFISASPSHKCNYDDDKKEWVSAELKKAADDDFRKPIFVFQHPHNTDTVYGSMLWGEDDLMSVYMDYPQIIHFSGHSHAPINSPKSIYQEHYTCLGTGTLSYFEMDEFDKYPSTFPENNHKAAQMLIVEADKDNRVRVYPYDVITGNFFPYVWKIDVPSEPSTFLYTSKRYHTNVVPVFKDNSEISFSDITQTSFKIEFPQAEISEDYVSGYNITVRNNQGRIVRQLSIWSEFYFYDMPSKRSVEITGLNPGTEYTVEIQAEGFWNNTSETRLTAKQTTK